MPVMPSGSPRHYRWAAPAVLLVSFVVAQMLLRGPSSYLSLGRLLITPFVLVAAAFAWPVFLKGSHLTTSLPGRIALFALSLTTSILAVLAIPLWTGHGCWAPDLATLYLFLVGGFILSSAAACMAHLIHGASPHRLNRISRTFIAVFLVTSFSLSVLPRLTAVGSPYIPGDPGGGLAPAESSEGLGSKTKSDLSGTGLSIAWSKRPIRGLLVSLRPLPWSRAAYAPADPAVRPPTASSPGALLFTGTPDRLEILDPVSGKPIHTVSLPSRNILRGDTARSTWKAPLVEGPYAVLRRLNNLWYPVNLDSGALGLPVSGDELAVCPHGIIVLTGRTVRLIDWSGRDVWTTEIGPQDPTPPAPCGPSPSYPSGPPPSQPGGPQPSCPGDTPLIPGRPRQSPGDTGAKPREFTVNEFYPLDPPLRMLHTADSIIVGINRSEQRGEAVALDMESGVQLWGTAVNGLICAMAMSLNAKPAGQAAAMGVLYLVVQSGSDISMEALAFSDNRQPGSAFRPSREPVRLWSWKLPEDAFGCSWAPTPGGLALALSSSFPFSSPSSPGREPELAVKFIDHSGKVRWEARSPREPYSIRYQDGMVILSTGRRISAYSPDDGRILWQAEPPVLIRRTEGTVSLRFEYYQDFLSFKGLLIVPAASGIVSFDRETGKRQWGFMPPGGYLGMATDDNMVFVTTSRGIIALLPYRQN